MHRDTIGAPFLKSLVLSDVLVPEAARRDVRAGAMVLTPNQEAARSLDVSSRTVAGTAARLLAGAGRAMASPLVERRIFRRAAVRAGGGSDPSGFASAAASTLREIMRATDPADVPTVDASPRVARLFAVVAEARRIAQEDNVVMAPDALWHGAEACRRDASLGERVVVVGYPRLPVAERTFLDAYAQQGSVVFLPCPDAPLFAENREAAEHFRELGWIVRRSDDDHGPMTRSRKRQSAALEDRGAPHAGAKLARRWLDAVGQDEAQVERPSDEDPVALLTYPDTEAEVRGVLGEVKRLLEAGVPNDRIAIVARQERAYGPMLLEVADEIEVPVRVLYDIPVAETRLGAWLMAGFDAMDRGWPFEETFRWLTHPMCDGLNREHVRPVRERHPAGTDDWEDVGVRLPDAELEPRPRRAWIAWSTALLERFGVPERAAAWPRETLAMQTLVDGLRDLPDPDEELDADRFLAELTELLDVLQVPMSPRRGGVELHTPLSQFGADVDHVFVVGAAEGLLPEPVRPDPLLDPLERSRVRATLPWLDDVRAQARREEISFWAVLQSVRERLVLSYPTLTARSETLPSPYLDRLGAQERSSDPRDVHSLREFRRATLRAPIDRVDDPVLNHARHAHAVEVERESGSDPGAHDGVTGRPFSPRRGSISATRVIDHASCPFRFWARTVLSIDEVREAPTTLDPLLRGSLIHDTLEHAVRRAFGRADLRAATLEALDDAMTTAQEELEANQDIRLARLPGWERDRQDLLDRLRRAVRSPVFLAEGAHVVALEQDFQGSWRGIPVHGRIDRIDVEDGAPVLIDYKSGGSVSRKAKDAGGRAKLDLQLPIYREGSVEVLGRVAPDADPERATTRYVSISKADTISSREPSDEEQERVARELEASWHAGAFPVDPDRGFEVCRTCPYDPVCRKGPRLERRKQTA